MQPILLSQRDKRWGNIPLGFSKTTTISSHGCLITCVSMKYGVTPDFLNERLKAVNGYLSENLLIWKKLEEALPGVKFVWKHNEYNNEIAKANIPVIVEVSGELIGGDRHWVLFIGNRRMYDPWDGQEKPTNTYGMPVSFVALEGEYKAEVKKIENNMYKGLDITNIESMKVAIDTWKDVVDGKFIDKKKHDEMMLSAQEAAKKKQTGILTEQEVAQFIEELEAIIKASGSISSWAQEKLDLLQKTTGKPQKKVSQSDTSSASSWLMKALGLGGEVK